MLYRPYEVEPLPDLWDDSKIETLTFRSYFQLVFEAAMFYFVGLKDKRSIWWFVFPATNIERNAGHVGTIALYLLIGWSYDLEVPFDLREYYEEEEKPVGHRTH